MIRTIHLHGALGKRFGREIQLAVDTPAEAVRALCTMLQGFEAHVTERYYQVFRGKKRAGIDLDPQELHARFADAETELHLVPRAAGAKRQGLGKIILGGLLIAASFVVPGGWAIAGKAVSGIQTRKRPSKPPRPNWMSLSVAMTH
jgi:predicted phage tail protein